MRDADGLRPGLASCLERAVSPSRVERDVPMARYTSFKIGGPADFLVTAVAPSELAAVIACCQAHGVPFLVLGRGTNLLVRDGGIRGVVVRLEGKFLAVGFEGPLVRAGAGAALADVARECGRRGLSGLEFAVGIPGSVGGAVVMNAGAYGGEMKDVVEAVDCLVPDPTGGGPSGDIVTLGPGDLDFGYRSSRPGREGLIVLSARFRLTLGDPAAIKATEDDYTARRRAKQPLDLPSAGSVFKRPEGRYVGTLIQEAGCKGLRVGDAQVSELHANFIVNLGSATARDVLTLIDFVQRRVQAHAGVRLEPEIRIVGEDATGD